MENEIEARRDATLVVVIGIFVSFLVLCINVWSLVFYRVILEKLPLDVLQLILVVYTLALTVTFAGLWRWARDNELTRQLLNIIRNNP